MPYLEIKNFKFGLDARRSELTSNPGSLAVLQDAHINQGGQIDKRKAFVPQSGFAGTFGMQETPAGIYVFGTDAVNNNVNPPFIYQRVQHPAMLDKVAGVTFDSRRHAIQQVVTSTQYNGLPWVAVQFTDGHTYCYYNGVLITDFTSGLALEYMTKNGDLARNITAMVNQTGVYTAIQDIGTYANSEDTFSQPGSQYSSTVIVSSKANIVVTSQQDVGYTQANVYAADKILNAVDQTWVWIGGKKYTFVDNYPTANGDVQIGATIAETLTNLYNAINLTGVAGTDYGAATTKNTNVFAQNLITVGTPSFQVVAYVSNLQTQIQNVIPVVQYAKEEDTVQRQMSAQAVGKFDITAANMATHAVGVMTNGNTGVPAGGTTVTIGGRTYSFHGNFDNVVDSVFMGGSGNSIQILYALLAVLNGQKTYVFAGNTYNSTGYSGTVIPNQQVTASWYWPPVGQPRIIFTAIAVGSAGNTTALSDGTGKYPVTPFSGGSDSQVTSIKVGPIKGTGTFVFDGTQPAVGEAVSVAGTVYTFTSTTPIPANSVLIGPNTIETMMNLISAINYTSGLGTDYNVTAANPLVRALPSPNGNVIQIIPYSAGSGSNYGLTSTSTHIIATNMAGGVDSQELLGGIKVSPQYQNSNSSFASAIANVINGYSATSGFTAKALGATVYIYTVLGNTYSNNADVIVTTLGQIAIGFCCFVVNGQDTPSGGLGYKGIAGTMNQIQIDGVGAMKNAVVLGGAGVPEIASPNPAYGFVAAIANSINTCTTVITSTGLAINATYIAVPVGNLLYLSRIVTSSSDSPLNVTVNASPTSGYGISISQVGANGLIAAVSPNYVGFRRYPIGGRVSTPNAIDYAAAIGTGLSAYAIARGLGFGGFGSHPKMMTESQSPIPVTCQGSGGFPPYKFNWQWVAGDQSFNVVPDNTKAVVTFNRLDTSGANTAYWKCVITDSLGNSIDSNVIQVYQP